MYIDPTVTTHPVQQIMYILFKYSTSQYTRENPLVIVSKIERGVSLFSSYVQYVNFLLAHMLRYRALF